MRDRFINATAVTIATFCGTGRAPFASGTIGSFVALLPIWLIHQNFGSNGLILFGIILFFVGIWASSIFIKISGEHDPKPVVIDEVVGQAITISFLPLGIKEYALAFVLFRIFDITKMWPANWAEGLSFFGLAVMLDDVIAGIYAGIFALIILTALS